MFRVGLTEKVTLEQSSTFNFLIEHFQCYFKSKRSEQLPRFKVYELFNALSWCWVFCSFLILIICSTNVYPVPAEAGLCIGPWGLNWEKDKFRFCSQKCPVYWGLQNWEIGKDNHNVISIWRGVQVAVPFLGDQGRLPEGMLTKLWYTAWNRMIGTCKFLDLPSFKIVAETISVSVVLSEKLHIVTEGAFTFPEHWVSYYPLFENVQKVREGLHTCSQ